MIGLLANRMPAVRIDGPRVYIRPPRRGDERQWIEIRRLSRDFLVPWEPSWPADATTPSAYRRRYRRFCEDWRLRCGFAFFVFEQGSDRLLGGITLTNVRRGVSQSGSIGYWMGQPYAGKGYMTEAVGLMLHFCFESLGLHRVEAACLLHNAASRALLRKLGFREEGVARRYLCINGRWQDHMSHAILRDDPRPSTVRRAAAEYA